MSELYPIEGTLNRLIVEQPTKAAQTCGTLREYMNTRQMKPTRKRRGLPKAKSELEEHLWMLLKAAGLAPRCVRNYKFALIVGRQFEFDFAFIHAKLAIECEGGIWRDKGAHNTGAAISRDIEKSNLAVELGWRLLRYTIEQIKSGAAISQIERILSQDHKRD